MDPTLIADQPGSTNFAKGFDIGEVKATPERPSHENYLKLYEISNGEVVDHRKEISLPALDSVSQRTTTLEEKMSQAEWKIEKLEESGTSDYLSIKYIVAESFKKNDEAYEYHLPLVSEVASDCPIWKNNLTKEIHIPRVSSGRLFNSLELYLKKVGEPSQNLEIEIRKAKKVSSFGLEFIIGGEILENVSVKHNEITTNYQLKTITLSKMISVAKDDFIIIVLKQQNGTINNSNYFCIWVSKNPSLGYGVVCVGAEGNNNKSYANVVCNSQWWYSNGLFGLGGGGFAWEKKRTLPDRYNFANWFPKNIIGEIVSPADEITVKIKVKCSNWQTNGGGGSTQWGFHVKLWSQILATYPYNTTAEVSKTVVVSTKMLEALELYVQADGSNYSTYYTRCDIDLSWEIVPKVWESLWRTLYSRKTVDIGGKWEFTVFGYHIDRTWKEEEPIWFWPVAVAFSGTKDGNSTQEKKFRSPRVSLCKMAYSLSSNYSWSNSLSRIEVWHNWVKIQTLSRNSDGYAECYFILPKWEITLKLYTWHTSWYTATMNYNLYIQ